EVISPGAERATVTVTLATPGGQRSIERSVGLAGRTSARIDGEPANADQLRALADTAIDIHGQSGQLALLRPVTQLAVLDAYAGLDNERARFATMVRELRTVRRSIESLRSDTRE